MSELERLVVLVFAALPAAKQTPEMIALAEVIDARCESARDYDRTSRGVHALERVKARNEKRDPDYAAAMKGASLKPGEV